MDIAGWRVACMRLKISKDERKKDRKREKTLKDSKIFIKRKKERNLVIQADLPKITEPKNRPKQHQNKT